MGNIALGYSVSNSASQYPWLGLVGRLVGDPLNTLPQGERIAFSGTTSQIGVNRWGDYSTMSIDPEDGCTFWFTSEYSTGVGTGGRASYHSSTPPALRCPGTIQAR